MIKKLKAWWTFTRPHTIIGSFLSITALFVITAAELTPSGDPGIFKHFINDHFNTYLITLLSALACNVFITGLNQWQDLDVDRINKPWLPLAAGTISLSSAKAVVMISLVVCLASAFTLGTSFFLLMACISGIGAAYSLPPLKLKRHHLPAAMAIVVVRGLLVNLGMSAHFAQQLNGKWQVPTGVWPLAIFVVGFSLGIAWFKDIPDTEGDEQFHFKTLAVTMSRKTALWLGVAVVSLSYLIVSASPFIMPMLVNASFFSLSHLALCLIFIYRASKLKLNQPAAIKSFYLFFWALFFLEYIIYPASYFIGGQ